MHELRAMIRGAWWGFRAIPIAQHAVTVDLRGAGRRLPRATRSEPAGIAGVKAALRLRRVSCLTRAVVLQAWRASYGDSPDVVIGVRGPAAGFGAHAWLDHEVDPLAERFQEVLRLRAPGT